MNLTITNASIPTMRSVPLGQIEQESVWEKLAADIGRFDYIIGREGRLRYFRLLFIVEFWAVFYFRMCELLGGRKGLVYFPFRVLLLFLKPLFDGMTGCRLRFGARIGGGFHMHHSVGVMIASESVIGRNCTVYGGAMVAHKANNMGSGAPRMGTNVTLLSGCKIIGPVNIGDGAVIGANAVVLKDVPPGTVAVGIPARIIRKDEKENAHAEENRKS